MKCIFGFDVKTTLNRNNVDASSSYRSVWVSRQQIAPKFEASTGLKIHESKREIKSYSYKIFQAQTKQTSGIISVLSTSQKKINWIQDIDCFQLKLNLLREELNCTFLYLKISF